MVKDRLPELKAVISKKNDQKKEKVNKKGSFKQIPLDQVNELYANLDELEKSIGEIKNVYKDILAIPQQDTVLENRLCELANIIRLKAYAIRKELKDFDDKLHDGSLLEKSGKFRVKSAQHTAISRMFINIMNEYNQIQVEYLDKCKARIRMKLDVAGLSFTEKEVDEMLEKNNPGIFTQAIMADTEAAKRSLNEIEARHANIIRLEKSISEMRDLFMNIALLVEQQGDLVDRVEYNINKTVDFVDSSKKKLSSAVIQKQKGRKRRLICLIILVVLSILLLIAIASAIGLT